MNKAFYIEAPDHKSGWTSFHTSIFLAGSITGAVNWQERAADVLTDKGYIVYNPRRENFDVTDAKIEREQITWEFNYLRSADTVIFYFSHETVAPITLFELGRALEAGVNLYIAIHPEYPRSNDIRIQSELAGFDQRRIFNSLEDMLEAIPNV